MKTKMKLPAICAYVASAMYLLAPTSAAAEETATLECKVEYLESEVSCLTQHLIESQECRTPKLSGRRRGLRMVTGPSYTAADKINFCIRKSGESYLACHQKATDGLGRCTVKKK